MHVVDKLRILAGKRKKAEVDCLVFYCDGRQRRKRCKRALSHPRVKASGCSFLANNSVL